MSLPEGVSMEQVIKVYNDYKRRNAARTEWFKTDEGKAYNRQKAKEYYARHKDKVLEKRTTEVQRR